MSAIKFIQSYATKSLTKNQGSGIINLPGAMQSEAKAGEIVAMLQQAGIPMNQLDDFIRSEADVAKFLNIIEAASKPKVYSGQAAVDQLNKLFPKKGEVVQFPQKTSFKEQVEAMKKSGDIVDPNNLKKNDKVTQRDMFKDSNLNKTDTVTDTITYIKTLEPMTAMKEANLIIGRKGKYKDLTPEQSKKILQDTEDHIFERDIPIDPEDMATGGRAGFQQGGLPAIDSRMNLDYDTLVAQNTDPRLQQSNNTSSYRAPPVTSTMTPIAELDKIREQVLKQQEGTMGPISLDNFEPQNTNPPTERILPMPSIPNNEKKLIERSQPGSLEEYLSGYEKYKSTNPNRYSGTQALINATLPGGIDYTFTSGSHANHFNDYLESIGLSPYQKNLNAISNNLDSAKFNKGGRAGFYTGGITDVEPSLDDIGHGADALNARTRLMSPGNQATTSTGLNYLLAEDNDNMRIPFAAGGGGRRAFLKLIASLGGTAAAFKSGLLSLGEGGTKKAVTETVKQAAGSGGQVPPYFLKLVEKIKTIGDDVTPSYLQYKDRQKVTKYKDYELTEDVTTGEKTIQRMKVDLMMVQNDAYYGKPCR